MVFSHGPSIQTTNSMIANTATMPKYTVQWIMASSFAGRTQTPKETHTSGP
jgi:hypothetical protein